MIIPDTRTAPWQGNVGVPGGIPTRTTIYKNIVTDLGADPTGVSDCTTIIHDAIEACPAGQVVYIPAGTFRLSDRVYVPAPPAMTVRGAGMGLTTLKPDNGVSSCLLFGSQEYPHPSTDFAITSGATRGSNTITLASTTAFIVDQPMSILTTPLPVWAHNLGGFTDTEETLRITFKIRSKTSTTVTFDPPCPFDFSGLNPYAQPWLGTADGFNLITGIGVESMTCNLDGTDLFCAVEMHRAFGCWIKEIEVNKAFSRVMYFTLFFCGELRGCYTHDIQGTGPGHEGIDFDGDCCWNLVENNICNKGGASPIQFGDSGGGNACNVVAYNYVTNTDDGFWDISFNHNPHNMLNLAEGNIIDNFKDDGYFGSSSHNTLFRNRINHYLELKHLCNYYNIVGNVLGTTGFSDAYETTVEGYSSNPIYALGYPNIGNHNYVGTFGPTTPPDYHLLTNDLPDPDNQKLDLNVAATIIRHGNFDYFNNGVIWDGGITDHSIPNSLYLTAQPSWWSGAPWPPIGSDLSPLSSKIPAQLRFEGATGVTAYGDLALKTFKPLSATGSFLGNLATQLTHIGAFFKSVAGNLTFVGSFNKSTKRTLAAILSFIGLLNRKIPQRVSAALSFIGSLFKRDSRLVAAAFSFTGNLKGRAVKALTGALSFVGTIPRKVSHLLQSVLSFVGNFASLLSHAGLNFLSFGSHLDFVGQINRFTRRSQSSVLSFIGLAGKRLPLAFTAAISFAGNSFKRSQKALVASIAFIGNLTFIRALTKALTASLAFIGTLGTAQAISRLLISTLNFIGDFTGNIPSTLQKTFSATLILTSTFYQRAGKVLRIVVKLVSSILKININTRK